MKDFKFATPEQIGKLFAVDRLAFVQFLNANLVRNGLLVGRLTEFRVSKAGIATKWGSAEPFFSLEIEFVDKAGRVIRAEGWGAGPRYNGWAVWSQKNPIIIRSANIGYFMAFLDAVRKADQELRR